MTKQAATLYRAIEHYIVGSNNDGALEHWRLAVGKSIERGQPFDAFLGCLGQLYTRTYGLPVRPAEGGGNSGTDAQPSVQ